jgi:hypothetical protein
VRCCSPATIRSKQLRGLLRRLERQRWVPQELHAVALQEFGQGVAAPAPALRAEDRHRLTAARAALHPQQGRIHITFDARRRAIFRGAGSRTPRLKLAAAETHAIPTDGHPPAWDRSDMTKNRKRSALDLFVEALLHPVRFR